VILTVLLGSGLLVNGILKNCWGRPRPADIAAFGGSHGYKEVWQPLGPGQGKSFPCGHCSIAFATGSAIAFFPLHPALSTAALAGSIIFGFVMGAARVAQGGHFATDVIWSGTLVFIVIELLYYYVGHVPDARSRSRPPGRPEDPS
jgi:lipid A 4'-phosphatase